ncbi:MAG: hypothetical protein CMI54_07870 [Parcubacteria group bacterium]|nr:hypothetical protein [Parcubacteria group bacterium]|tara:strand:+ start:7644 stop:9212 length:1569 start_codon:yes stop_codon:yes gene_type:complete
MASPIVDYSVDPVIGNAPLVVTITLNSVILDDFDLQGLSIAHFGFVDESGVANGFQQSHFGYYLALPSITYLWNFGDGNSFVGENPPQHTYIAPGTYILRLILVVNGVAYQYPTEITAKEVLSSLVGIGQSLERTSLTYGNDETQGIGWSTNSGDSHVWPDSNGSLVSIFNEQGDHEEIVFDSIDGFPYIYNTRKINSDALVKESWKGRLNPLDSESGIEIVTRVRLQEYKGSHESYYQQMSDINLFYQPMRIKNQGQTGYDAKGLRSAFEVDLELYADEKLEKVAHAHDVPVDRELFFDRKIKGNILQIAIETTTSEYRFTRSEVYLTNYDHARWPSQPQMTEKTYQFNADNDLGSWLTRSTNLLKDNNMVAYGDSSDYLASAGPDNYNASAFTVINPSNLNLNLSTLLGFPLYFITIWSTNQNGPTFSQAVPPTVDVVDSLEARINPDDPNDLSTRTWYFLNIVSDSLSPISSIEFIDGDSYFDMRGFESNATINSTETLQYIFDDVKENNANSICPSWF